MTPLTLPPDAAATMIEFEKVNEWVVDQGRDFAVIEGLEDFDPFFLSLATVTNQWLFCSSNGALSAGRENPEKALFPYLTVDKILGNWNVTGPFSAVECDGEIWHPFWPTTTHRSPVRRRLLKSDLGDELVFEEVHEKWQLRFSYRWQLSGKYGFVRKVRITNEGDSDRDFRIIDGLQDLQVSGVSHRLHLELSCLADAYRMSELTSGGALMIHRLASGIVDAPIPLESLKATTVWTAGFEEAQAYLSRQDAEEFLKTGRSRPDLAKKRGEKGAFLLGADLSLPPGESKDWIMVSEIEQSHREVGRLMSALEDKDALRAAVEEDLEEGRDRLRSLSKSVDGIQITADRDTSLYHYHNTLCNFLRGGLPENGSVLSREQFIHFLEQNNRGLVVKFGDWLSGLPDAFERNRVIEQAGELGDPDLLRLTIEYLPLILGRRHGDPSRPWNKFNIKLADEEGRPVHHYEGNWRDIFQNWEALAWSYPVFLDGFISRFLNASTIDGFNPYRVTSAGVDWEVPDADDPWVSIGYWGDHQIIYLLKFLELKEKINPGFMASESAGKSYVFADVPYRIAGWEKTLTDPRDTVEFDQKQHDDLMSHKAEMGGDGLLLRDASGEPVRVTLTEKLLIPAIAKLGQLVPGGGIWMNTQKPEWNDANNALAGNGLSVVTTGYLLRYVRFLTRMISGSNDGGFSFSKALATAVSELTAAMGDPRWRESELPASDRFELAKANGLIAERYRKEARVGNGRESADLTRDEVLNFLSAVSIALKGVLQANRREDGLWHSYNVLELGDDRDEMVVRHLQLMLEGQVAILSSGLLSDEEAVSLLEKLAVSELRSKRHPTYLLYPDRELPTFEELNRVPGDDLYEIPSLVEMVKGGDQSLVYQDDLGDWRFDESLVNGYALAARLDEVTGLSDQDRKSIENLYEAVFTHHSFTGRSGSMFGYEGLGCVYWHMVSKLMLASQEVSLNVLKSDGDEELKHRAVAAYYSVQRGLGFRQSPKMYGAFPAEPYSHSQGERGAQQPGLTGQVKEGILCRMGELGIDFQDGQLSFRPRILRSAEFTEGEISFTYARTPVTFRIQEGADDASALVKMSDDRELEFSGAILDHDTTSLVIEEEDCVQGITVTIPGSWLIS